MKPPSQAGFALVITLVLLALLVLAVFALSALTKVSGETSLTSTYQTQARQNALLGLSVGLGELQRCAGPDARVTGMAGITGILPASGNTTRHWCGVWDNNGQLLAWLASGAQPSAAALQSGVTSIELIANGTVGAATSNSEHVIAGKIPISVSEVAGAPGVTTTIGQYAYVVSDEGVKTAAYAPVPVLVVQPVIYPNATAQTNLRDALAANPSNVPRMLSYEQLALLPTPGSSLTRSVLQDNFHHVTLSNFALVGTQLQSGMFNVNTNSIIAWRNLLQTYNAAPAAPAQIPSGTLSTRGTNIQNSIVAYTTSGKAPNGPFTTIAAFSSYLATIFTPASTPNYVSIMNTLDRMFAVRSDTFRIRAYGEALNPTPKPGNTIGDVEASTYCEAVVQRIKTNPTATEGRFVIIYFRWLAPPNPADSTQTDI